MPAVVSIIDDSIPAHLYDWIDETKSLGHSCLKALVDAGEDSWDEQPLYQLMADLLDGDWRVSGFRNPEIFINTRDEEGFLPDVVVFDWEYTPNPRDPLTQLVDILRGSHAYVAIYSSTDHQSNIDQALKDTQVEPFLDRVSSIEKSVVSANTLKEKLQKQYETNFSGRYSRDIRRASQKAVESVLVEMGKYRIGDILFALGEKKEVAPKDFIAEKASHKIEEIFWDMVKKGIKGKFRQDLHSSILDSGTIELDQESDGLYHEPDADQMAKLLEYAMYYKPNDRFVRQGDILSESEQRYLVVNKSCDLERFWMAGLGNLILIPLHEWGQRSKSSLSIKLAFSRKRGKIQEPSSLTNSRLPGCFLLPYTPDKAIPNQLLIGAPSEITSKSIDPPQDIAKAEIRSVGNRALLYDDIEGYTRLFTLSESFSSELVSSCLYMLLGAGTNDYPDSLQKSLHALVKNGLPLRDDILGS